MDKRIYFCGSIKGGRADIAVYKDLIGFLKNYGKVLTEHIAEDHLVTDQHLSDKEIHDRDIDWLKSADLVIAEVTQPSHGVGYEVAQSLEMGKKVVCLHRNTEGRRLSAMISGAEGVTLIPYTDTEEAKEVLLPFLKA